MSVTAARPVTKPVMVYNLLARIIGAREAIECRDLEYAEGILADLEQEIAKATGADKRPYVCRAEALRAATRNEAA